MPRPPRLDIPGIPVHVIQRGVNRCACFFGDVDRRFYLKLLAKFAARRGCALHAYVLMTNHVHLLLTPDLKGATAALMQDLGRAYVRTINSIHGRTGTLWEGRFKSSIVDSERYFLTCQRYIELNPVRAGLAHRPCEYPWSSHAHYAGTEARPFLVAHECITRLGVTEAERRDAYRQLFQRDLSRGDLQTIREAANRNGALGTEEFLARLGVTAGRKVGPVRRGRPRNDTAADSLAPISNKLL